jgi:hypothetical protein
MNLDDLKDQLKEQGQAVWSRIQESSTYIQISEKYSDMNPATQKAALIGTIVLSIFLVLAVPIGYLTSASESVTAFEDKKALLRELYRVNRASSELDAAPAAADPAMLVSQAQNQLTVAHIPPELVKGVREFDNSSPQPGSRALPNVPKAVMQKGVEVSLTKMNLRQVVDLGFQLQAMNRGLKMIGLSIDADIANPHYFDVVYQLVSFSLPVEAEPVLNQKGKGSKKPARSGGKKAPTEEPADAGSPSGEGV